MKRGPWQRLPLFRSDGQASLLVELFVHADGPASLTELAERTGQSIAAVHREVERLEAADLVTSNRVGRVRQVEANRSSPYYRDLRSLLLSAFGPAHVLRVLLAQVEGIDHAFLYGSWAASAQGGLTRQPRDLDLMVVGRPDLDRLYQTLREVEEAVRHPVNVTVLEPEEWERAASGFLVSVREGPKIEVA